MLAPLSTPDLAAAAESGRTDVSEGDVALVTDLYPGRASSHVQHITVVGDQMFFTASADDDGHRLWVSDGTEAGTRVVPVPELAEPFGSTNLTAVGDQLYFTARDDVHGIEIWRTDGSASGTVRVTDSTGRTPRHLTAVGDSLYFARYEAEHGDQVWRADDAVAGGAVRMSDVEKVAYEDDPYYFTTGVYQLTAVEDQLFFTARDRELGHELWRSDGTFAGTGMVKDIRTQPSAPGGFDLGSRPRYLTAVGGTLYFTALDDVHGNELWRSDGTAAGTRLVADVKTTDPSDPAYRETMPLPVGALGGRLFFTAEDDLRQRSLWVTDGTAAGTEPLADVSPHGSWTNLTVGQDTVVLDGVLYFSAVDHRGRELWRSDGTPAGTSMVADLSAHPYPFTSASAVGSLTKVGETLFFTADHGGHGSELWRSDGTAEGTGLVYGTEAEHDKVNVGGLVALQHQLFFTSEDRETGRELWRASLDAATTPVIVNVDRPTVSGPLVVGGRLTGTPGTWATPGVTLDYQWFLDASHAPNVAITGATGTSLLLNYKNERDLMSFRVVASRPGYHSTVVRSAYTPRILASVKNLELPGITGVPRVGAVLTASRGTWERSQDWDEFPTRPYREEFSYQWYVGIAPVPGATQTTFTVPDDAAGKRIAVVVTASSSTVQPTAAIAVPTSPVGLAALRLTRRPAIFGPARVGRVVRAAPGSVAPLATRVDYQWLRGGTPIGGATGPVYRLTRADRGRKVGVRVIHRRTGHRAVVVTAPPTGRVRR